jgi:hypothetical protein
MSTRPEGNRCVLTRAVLIAFGGLISAWPMASAPAEAAATTEIYKCTDRSGNITYQNEKCPTGSQAGRVDIFDNNWTANRAEKDAQWQRSAADHRVVTGMPARWVREGFGEPAEIRDTATGGAKELWVYNLPDRTLQIGMLDEQVQWFRETPTAPSGGFVQAPSSSAPAATSNSRATSAAPGMDAPKKDAPKKDAPRPIDILQAPDALRSLDAPRPSDTLTPKASPRASEVPTGTEAPRAVEAPRAAEVPRAAELPRATDAAPAAVAADGARRIARGRDCREVLAELGPPDRQREIPGDGGSSAMTEYLYEPSGSAEPARTRILCANGRVEGVDRSVAH